MDGKAVKAFFVEQIRSSLDCYLSDLESMSEEDLGASPGGSARSGFDFTYEVAFNNERFTKRLRLEPLDKYPDGWITAPEQFRSKAAAIDYLRSSTEAFLQAFAEVPDEDLLQPIVLPSGQSSALEYAYICASHMSYHDAQLNLMQSLKGDLAVHWSIG